MEEPRSSPDDAVLFFGVSLVLGIGSRHLLRSTRVPYTAALLVLGVALGGLEYGTKHGLGKLGAGIRIWAAINPDLLLAVFLPALLFESSFSMEVHQIKPVARLADALSAFLLSASAPVSPPLLPAPSPPPAALPPPPPPVRRAAPDSTRQSARLAAKPNKGLSAEEKARLVLLRRGGIMLQDGPPSSDDIERYRQLYQKELPDTFVRAISDLVEATVARSKGQTGKGLALCA